MVVRLHPPAPLANPRDIAGQIDSTAMSAPATRANGPATGIRVFPDYCISGHDKAGVRDRGGRHRTGQLSAIITVADSWCVVVVLRGTNSVG